MSWTGLGQSLPFESRLASLTGAVSRGTGGRTVNVAMAPDARRPLRGCRPRVLPWWCPGVSRIARGEGEVSRILEAIGGGGGQAAGELRPLVYDERRRLAAQRLARERPGQTLQATALVHEAYLRLVGADSERMWASRAHFLAAAAEAMRRIL